MSKIGGTRPRAAFDRWLRTGIPPSVSADGVELKFNPWHDPEDGKFTHAGAGRNFGTNRSLSVSRQEVTARQARNRDQRPAQPLALPLRKIAEFAGGVGDGVKDVVKTTAPDLYDTVTTNPVTTVRDFGRGVAKTIDAAIAAEDIPAALQVRHARHAISSASARDLGYATAQVVGNVGLTAAPGLAASKISTVRRLKTARFRETFSAPNPAWPKETMLERGQEAAKRYNDTAPGARSGRAPALTRTMPDGSKRFVKVDGVDGDYMIDRKWSIRRNQKAKDQALRQSSVLFEHRLNAVWELPNEKMRGEATRFLKALKIKNIKTRVVAP